MSASRRGVTLVEVLLASAITFVIVMGIGSLDIMRFRIEQDLRQRSGLLSPEQREAAIAALFLSKQIERADRSVIREDGIPGAPMPSASGPGKLQLRTPELDTDAGPCTGCSGSTPSPCCLDIAANYRWDEFRLNGDRLEYFRDVPSGCGAPQVMARQITDFTLAYMDRAALAPPGGEPFDPDTRDSNLLRFTILWDDGGLPTPRTHEFLGEIALNGAGYTELGAGCPNPSGPCDSGRGLALPGVNDVPPPPC